MLKYTFIGFAKWLRQSTSVLEVVGSNPAAFRLKVLPFYLDGSHDFHYPNRPFTHHIHKWPTHNFGPKRGMKVLSKMTYFLKYPLCKSRLLPSYLLWLQHLFHHYAPLFFGSQTVKKKCQIWAHFHFQKRKPQKKRKVFNTHVFLQTTFVGRIFLPLFLLKDSFLLRKYFNNHSLKKVLSEISL